MWWGDPPAMKPVKSDIRKFFGSKGGAVAKKPAEETGGSDKAHASPAPPTKPSKPAGKHSTDDVSSPTPKRVKKSTNAVTPSPRKSPRKPQGSQPSPSPLKGKTKPVEKMDLVSGDEEDDKDDDFVIAQPKKERYASTSKYFMAGKKDAPAATDASAKRSSPAQKRATPDPAPAPSPLASPSAPAATTSPPASKRLKAASKVEESLPSRDWMPPVPPESSLKFSVGEGNTAWQSGGPAPGSDPPNKGKKQVPRGKDGCLEGLAFSISGTLDSLDRDACADLIKRHGGRYTTNVSGKTSFLVVGTECGKSKYESAKKHNTPLIDEDALFAILSASHVQSDTKQLANKPAVLPPVGEFESKFSAGGDKSAKPMPTTPGQPKAGGSSSGAVAAMRTLPASVPKGQAAAPVNELWVMKHKPKEPKDLIGNGDKIRQLREWLANWHRVNIAAVPGAKKVAVKDAPKKAVLISGPPGLGKTSSATIIAKALGFAAIEVNASDTRGKTERDIEGGIGGRRSNAIREMVTNRSVSVSGACTRPQNQVLIMDEVDGMSGSAERGGMMDLIETIKLSKIPIICICNDAYNTKVKSLQNYCLDLKFSRPNKNVVASRMVQIAASEGLKVDQVTMETLVETCNNDIRWVLNTLQMRRKASTTLTFDDVKGGSSKDLDMSPFNVCDALLGPRANAAHINERINLMFQDADLMPLFIAENYINMVPASAAADDAARMDLVAQAAQCVSDGDLVNRQVRGSMKWSLMPFGNFTYVHAASLVCGRREPFDNYERFHRFPQWLGKNSSQNKQRRLLGELHLHATASTHFTANRFALRESYLPLLRQALTAPMRSSKDGDGKSGIPGVLELMHTYGFTREDWDSILDMTKFKGKNSIFSDPAQNIPTGTKSQFTRECNKATGPVHYADGQIKGMKKSKGRGRDSSGMEGLEGEEENGNDEEGDDTKDQAQNKLGKISAAKLKRINFEGDGGSVSKPIKGKSKGAAVGMKSGKTSKRK